MKEYHEEQEAEIKELLIGRRVTKISEDMLMLDNNTVLRIVPNEGCGGCSSGWYEITELNECPNNRIMNVIFEREDKSEPYDEAYTYRIFVLAEDTRLKLLEVDGSDGNGYYGTGYMIEVFS